MSGMFGGSTNTQTQEIYSGIQVSSSILGQPLPYVAGRQRIPFNLAWYGNFQVMTSNSGGGKGGGGQSTKQYSYSAAFIAALCLGPITGIFQIWHDKALETLTTENLAIAFGGAAFKGSISGTTLTVNAPVQGFVTNGVLTSTNGAVAVGTTVTSQLSGTPGGAGQYSVSHSQTVASTAMFVAQPIFSGYPAGTPTIQMLPYDHLAYVASSAYNLGSSAGMPNLTFEVEGIVPGFSDANGIFDADPSAVFPNYLLDGVVGALAGYPGTPLVIGSTDAPLAGVTNSYQAYCLAMGLLTSPYEYTQRQATDFTAEILQCTNSDVFLSYGTLKVFPYCDQAVSGTVAGTTYSYTPNLTPVYILTDDDYVVDDGENPEPPVKLHITAQSDTYNEVNVEYLDRSNFYNAAPVNCTDDDDIAKYGPRLASSLSWHQITVATVAKTAGQLWLQRQLREVNSYEFKTRRDFSLLEPGIDFVSLNDANLGLVNQLCQVESMEVDEDQFLNFIVREIPGVTRSTAQFDWSAAQGFFANYATDPGLVQTPLIFQMPPIPAAESNGITLGIAVCGQTANAAWLGCDVYASLDGGTTYQFVGRMPEACRYGTIITNLGQVPDPDTGSTLTVALANSNLQLSTAVTHAEADSMQTPILIFGGTAAEVMSFGDAALVSAGTYNLSYLRRGLYGSTDQAHSDTNEGGSGLPANFVRLDGAIFQIAVDPGMAGQTIFFKFVSFNSFQKFGPQTLSGSTAYPYTVPSGITVVGQFLAAGSAAAVETSAYKIEGSAAAWDSSVFSTQSFNNGCSVQCYPGNPSAATLPAACMLGLTNNPQANLTGPNNFTNLEFALFMSGSAGIQIYESGALIGTFASSYTTSTLLQILYDGKHVQYYIGGVLARSVPITNQTFFMQSTFFDPGASIFGLTFSSSTQVATPFTLEPMSINVAAAGTIVKSNKLGTTAFGNKNFQSKESFSQGAILSFVVNPLGDAQFMGFSQAPATGDTTGLLHTLAGWYPHAASSTCEILFNGASLGGFGPYASPGEVFTIEYDNFFFYWYRNNTLIHQEYFTAAGALFLFGDFFEDNQGFSNVYFGPNGQISPNPFYATGQCVVHDSTAMKIGGAVAFDSFVYSLNAYLQCHVQFKPSTASTSVKVGLSAVPQANENQIYSWFFDTTSPSFGWRIFELGTTVTSFVPGALTDLAAVTYDGTTITYFLNGVSVHTTALSGALMYAAASFNEPGSTINSLSFGPGTSLDTVPTISIDPNAATSVSTSSLSAATVGNFTTPNVQGSITVGPFPFDTTVILTVTGQWQFTFSGGTTQNIAIRYGISAVSTISFTGALITVDQSTSANNTVNGSGPLSQEIEVALAANTTTTYNVLAGENPSGILGTAINITGTIKAEVIKR
jgi:hypothetical protein